MATGVMDRLPPYIDLDDVRQVKALARIEAEAAGLDPERAALAAAIRYVGQERGHRRRFAPASILFPRDGPGAGSSRLRWAEGARAVVRRRAPRKMRPAGRANFPRAQAILVLWIAGFSAERIAGLFGLSRFRVCRILDKMRAMVA
jgi:hypothetical protein